VRPDSTPQPPTDKAKEGPKISLEILGGGGSSFAQVFLNRADLACTRRIKPFLGFRELIRFCSVPREQELDDLPPTDHKLLEVVHLPLLQV
jgi:hypothetical protein